MIQLFLINEEHDKDLVIIKPSHQDLTTTRLDWTYADNPYSQESKMATQNNMNHTICVHLPRLHRTQLIDEKIFILLI